MSSVYLKPAKVAKVVLLPGIFPRLKHLFGGFDYIPFLMAQVFGIFGLLPAAHPYLQNDNIGRFGVAKLMAASAQSFEWTRENTDKIILYMSAVLGICLIALMFFAGVIYLSALPVWAASIFATPNPDTDLAFHILDRVIGVPGVYNPNFTAASPFQSGIHAILRMYSSALFAFAFVYLLYYIFTIVAETAITGTPFGKRFHKIYGPIRLVTAIGLLLPFGSYGLNSAQYIVLYAAKYGSGLATNAWIEFNQVSAQPFGYGTSYTSEFPQYVVLDTNLQPQLVSPGSYESRGLIAVPDVPNAKGIAGIINVIHTCQVLYKTYKPTIHGKTTDIQPYLAKGNPNTSLPFIGTKFKDAKEFYKDSDIIVYFGQQDDTAFADKIGHLSPYCGSITIPITRSQYLGMDKVREVYYNIIQQAFTPANDPLFVAARGFAENMVARRAADQTERQVGQCYSNSSVGGYPNPDSQGTYQVSGTCDGEENGDKQSILIANHISYYGSQVNAAVAEKMYPTIRNMLQAPQLFEIPQEVYEYGWAGAGIWFNRISELNSDVFQSLHDLPRTNKPPPLLERALDQGSPISEGLSMLSSIFGDSNDTRETTFNDQRDREMSEIMMTTWNYWASEETETRPQTSGADNAFIQAIAYVFGASPILTIRDNTGVHPFAQLTAIGKGLIEKAITALTLAGGLSFAEGMISSIPDDQYQSLTGFFKGKAALLKAIAFTGLTAGFIMYYIVPFMPFLYFFFAVSGWVKSIFEAMVGAPLWALAHMKLEGDSFLSKQSLSGYYLTLEIFMRPILVLIGLFAASTLFAALVLVLNMMFDLVTANMTGIALDQAPLQPDQIAYYRSVLDQLFFLIMYVIIVYLLSSVCFKMTDEVPNNITRWMSAGIKSFGDMAKDPAEQLTTYASMAGYRFAPKISDMVMDGSRMAGNITGSATNRTDAQGNFTGSAVKDMVDGALGVRPQTAQSQTQTPTPEPQTPAPTQRRPAANPEGGSGPERAPGEGDAAPQDGQAQPGPQEGGPEGGPGDGSGRGGRNGGNTTE